MTNFFHERPASRFTRARMVRAIKTFFWVACVTALIFVYADLEKTESDEFRVKIVFSAGPSSGLALLGGEDMRRQGLDLTFKASGSRSGLDRCRRELLARGGAIAQELSAHSPGRVQVTLRDILSKADAVRDSGLTVQSVDPVVADLTLDKALHVPDVEVKYPDNSAEAVVQPARVGVTLPQSRWDKLRQTVRAADLVLKTRLVPAGVQADPNKPLRVEIEPYIAGTPVVPDQAFADVQLRVTQATEERKLKVAVRIVTPLSWATDDTWQRFVLKQENPLDWQKEVTFRGPRQEIEKLSVKDVDAFVTLTDDDKPKAAGEAWRKRDVEIRLPRDSHIQAVGERPSVQFRLDPRTETSGG